MRQFHVDGAATMHALCYMPLIWSPTSHPPSSQKIKKGGARWEKIALESPVAKKGWHFVEFTNNQKVVFYEQSNTAVGLLFHQSIKESKSGFLNPYSRYLPSLPNSPHLSSSLALEVFLPNVKSWFSTKR